MLQYPPRLPRRYFTMPASVNRFTDRGGYVTMSVSVNVLTKTVAGMAALPRITEAGNRAIRLRGHFENVTQKILCSSECHASMTPKQREARCTCQKYAKCLVTQTQEHTEATNEC
jgi:hypothetical protein